MGYLVRMIKSEQHWAQYQQEIPEVDQISADSISELTTDDNCLSTWYIDTLDSIDTDKAVLALTSGFRSLDSIMLVALDMENLEQYGLIARQSPETARTKVKGYEKYHYDIIDLTHRRLGNLAQFIMTALRDGKIVNVNTFSIVEILVKAMAAEIVDFDSLEKGLRAGLAKAIKKDLNKPDSKFEPIIDKHIKGQVARQLEMNKQKTNCNKELQCGFWKHT